MKKLILAIHDILNRIKDFEVGYTSKSDNAMIIDFQGERYIIRISKIENKDESMMKDIDRYL